MKLTRWMMLSAVAMVWSSVSVQAGEGTAAVASQSALKVDLKIGTSIENRELVGEAASFSESVGQVVAWTLIEGAQEPTEISHVWLLNGEEKSSVKLNVASARFRTNSKKIVTGLSGKWEVQVKDISGNVLTSKAFDVTP